MKCERVEKLLYLHRAGELREAEKSQLRQHLNHCGSCRESYGEVKQLDHTMEYLRADTPEIADKNLITDSILYRIQSNSALGTSGLEPSIWDTITEILSKPRIRAALIGVSVCMIGVFIIQELFILHRISRLEEKMSNRTSSQIEEIHTDPAESDWDEDFIQILPPGIADSWMLISKNNMQSILNNLHQLQNENAALRKMLEEEFPELGRIIEQQNLTSAEFRRLMKERDNIVRALKQL